MDCRVIRAASVMLFLCVPFLAGCDDNQRQDADTSAAALVPPTATDRTSDDLDGPTILRETVVRYVSAKSYQDRAVLYLNYRLEGKRIQEPHPFSTIWLNDNRLASKVFNSQINCDGQLLSCYIYDIESANLDNQQLYLPVGQRMPIRQLYRDAIARHFLGGYSELPLDESAKALPPKLIPPPVSLLTAESSCGWIQQAEKVQRLEDGFLDQQACFVIRSLFNDATADIWIDQRDFLIRKISFPLKIMAREVLTTGQIQDVELIAHFHEAAIDVPVGDEAFAIKRRAESKPVRKFVSIPESFPSELIGQPAAKFQLFKPSGGTVDNGFFEGKSTALLWFGGASSFEYAVLLDTLSKQFESTDFCFGAVYSDMELASPGSGSIAPNRKLESVIDSMNIPVYYDQHLEASGLLKIKAIPAIVVLGPDLKVQFAKALSNDQWPEELKVTLNRIHRGDDVAAEMNDEYQRFLDGYHEKLARSDATDLLDSRGEESQHANAPRNATGGKFIADGYRSPKLIPKLKWSNSDLQRPGNLMTFPQEQAIFVIDGWQTVVKLNLQGELIERFELQLPVNEAVSCLRHAGKQTDSGSKVPAWAVFEVQGRQVHLFDDDWQYAKSLPDTSFQHEGIQDVQFGDLNQDGIDEIVISFAGQLETQVVDLKTEAMTAIPETLASSLATRPDRIFFCNATELGFCHQNKRQVDTCR